MKINVAYLHNSISVVKDTTKPLLVTSCGYYLVKEGPVIKTNRPKGRRDYQLIYIAEGRGHFFFKDGTRIVNKGEMILFRPYEPQSYYYYPQDQCEAYWAASPCGGSSRARSSSTWVTYGICATRRIATPRRYSTSIASTSSWASTRVSDYASTLRS